MSKSITYCILHWAAGFALAIAGMVIFSGCAAETAERVVYQTVYKDVYVPVKCETDIPPRPNIKDKPAVMLANLIQYTKQLEAALKLCTGG